MLSDRMVIWFRDRKWMLSRIVLPGGAGACVLGYNYFGSGGAVILVFSPGPVNDLCQNWDLNVNFYQIDLYVAIIIKIFHSLYKYVNVRLQNGYKMSTFTWFSYILRLYVVCYWGRVSSMLIIFVRTLICTHTD